MGFVGPNFTWSKHFEDGLSLWERLDRGLDTSNWFLKFPSTRVTHLSCNSSDHLPLIIYLTGLEIHQKIKYLDLKKMWLFDARCGEIVEVAWTSTRDLDHTRAILQKVD